MADETDVPPLEDMSDLLQKVQIIKEKRTKTSSQNQVKTEKKTVSNGHCTVSDKNMAPANKPAQIQSKLENTEPKPNPKPSAAFSQSSSGFGGMKKGFMFGGGSSQPKPSQEKTKEASVPYVKKNEESLKLDEVQQAMSDTITSKKDEWMTDDLLSKVEKNETLLKKLQDPRFMEAVDMFQRNPTAAMERYKNDKETQDAFMQFCGLMGNHFTNIADKDGGKTEEKTPAPQKPSPKIIEEIDPADSNKYVPTNPPSASQRGTILTRQSQGGADMSVRSSTNPKQATAEDENKMQDILSQPDVMDVLMDPWIQNLFHVLRNDPGSGQRMLLDADSEKKKKIKKLVDVGMLQFQT
ncbi:uncharacterized protein LOC143049998 [Mytilus galloprovincialis]|uniref:uncharacterized protein LOC143049998 n=1 Tax=Mytilus galloprovincialis TaxID=29158 RepID=UPI003F7C8ACB